MFIQKLKNKRLSVGAIGILFIVVAMICIQLFCFSDGISGNDFWWHIKVGEWVCKNGRVPTSDIFSWYGTAKELPWTAHEWLSDVIYFLLYDGLGEAGVFWFCLLMAMIMGVIMVIQVRQELKQNILIGGLFFILYAVVSKLFFYGRPHVFSYFLLFWELKILYDYIHKPKGKSIYFLPVIGCLWSNLHGGSSNLSYLLCFVFLIVSCCDFKFGRIFATRLPKKARIRLAMVGIGTVASLLVNPIGIRVLTFPYTSIGDELMMSVISEWAAPDVKILASLILFFGPIILMTMGIISEEKKVHPIDILVMGMFLYLFLRSARFIMLWYIAACFYAFQYMPKCRLKELTKKSEKVLLLVCLLVFLIPIGVGVRDIVGLGKEDYISKMMTEEAVEAVKNHPMERTFNDYNLGETLICNDIPVFFDARADMYLQENIFADGISLMTLSQKNDNAKIAYVDVEGIIEKYQFDSILILKERALYSYMLSQPERFACIYEDDTVAYFELIE